MPNFDKLIEDFINKIDNKNIITTYYNEKAIQHELGEFLRQELDKEEKGKYLVQFEKNINYFKPLSKPKTKGKIEKTEMDIVVFENDTDIKDLIHKTPICAVELKFLKRYPQSFSQKTPTQTKEIHDYLQDIEFAEYLKSRDVENSYAILFTDNQDVFKTPGKPKHKPKYTKMWDIFRTFGTTSIGLNKKTGYPVDDLNSQFKTLATKSSKLSTLDIKKEYDLEWKSKFTYTNEIGVNLDFKYIIEKVK